MNKNKAQHKKCLVVTCGYFGDILFSTSLAEKLKSEQNFNSVDYLIGFPQVSKLVQNNKFIDEVYISVTPSPHPTNDNVDKTQYDKTIYLQPLNFQTPPAYEYQQFAQIEKPSPTYQIYTDPIYDEIAQDYVNELKQNKKSVIALMSNWQSKTYKFTPEQYKAGIDVPNLGYGGSHRDIPLIIQKLQENFNLLEVGIPPQYNQYSTISIKDNNQKSLLFEASLIKFCDFFVGTDGGLATIAAGVGTKTIITGDFNLQLYGWNGVIKKIDEPKLGPIHYFPNGGHVVLDPYLTDIEVAQSLIQNIKYESNI